MNGSSSKDVNIKEKFRIQKPYIMHLVPPNRMSICQHKSRKSCAKYQMSWINNHGNGFAQFVSKKWIYWNYSTEIRAHVRKWDVQLYIIKKNANFSQFISHFNWNRKFVLSVAKRNDRIGDNVSFYRMSGTFTCAIKRSNTRNKHRIC